MKIITTLLIIAMSIGFTTLAMAQSKKGEIDARYRRSSLHTILVEYDNFPRKETVVKSYYNAPFPDKYNNHTIGAKSFDPKRYALTNEERTAVIAKRGKPNEVATNTISENDALPYINNKYLKQNQIARQMVAKWFNRQADGTFNMQLVAERGFYNATEMEAKIAKGTIRGVACLADAGEELIKNTFVVVSKLNFVSNEIAARIVRDQAYAKAKDIPNKTFRDSAIKAADIAYNKAKEGYSVWTTTYLYQLRWNDSIAAVFYNDLWMDKSNVDPVRKDAFDKTDMFKLEFIGDENSSTLVLFSLTEKRSEDRIIEIATIRNMDAVYSKLQKKYDVFKTKTPIHSLDPLTAKIGMKEGVEAGDKFEVLEQTLNSKTGLTEYISKGSITADKKLIWDNRYNAAEDPDSETAGLSATTFKGKGKNFYVGMLIRQIK